VLASVVAFESSTTGRRPSTSSTCCKHIQRQTRATSRRRKRARSAEWCARNSNEERRV
jgi:hypothetical protein